MTRPRIAVLLIGAVALASSGRALAQGGPGSGPGRGRGQGRLYDPKTVETVAGEIVSVQRVTRRGGRSGGVHLILKTDKESLEVHLGPAWYLDKQSLKLAQSDHVEVRGSRVTFHGKPDIIAATVKKGDQTLTLRDGNGVPVWRGQGRGSGVRRATPQ